MIRPAFAVLLLVAAGAAQAAVRIPGIQGPGMQSPLADQVVRDVPGVVTAVDDNGFFIQDPAGDGDPATSDGLFAYTGAAPRVRVGDVVSVSGQVQEYRPGGEDTGNLTITEIRVQRVRPVPGAFASPRVEPVLIGPDGRSPPDTVISAAAWQGAPPDPVDGIHFHERLEGMLVRIGSPRVVAPIDRYGQVWVVPGRGRDATGMNRRGGITIRPLAGGVDFNPERIQLEDSILRNPVPPVRVGDVLSDALGVVHYAFGNYEVRLAARLRVVKPAGSGSGASLSAADDALSIATYNVENLDPNDADGDRDRADGRFARIAADIVEGLGAPAIIAMQEIQDNDGARDSGVTAADRTLGVLIDAIRQAGGPAYAWTGVAPKDGADGGQPGGNIRNVFLYDPNRVSLAPAGPMLQSSPARIAAGHPAFRGSRKPVVALFQANGRRLLMINCHFTSKLGSTPLYGRVQPPVNAGAERRRGQARVVADFVAPVLARRPDMAVIVLGDFNEFAFLPPLRPLIGPPPDGAGLTDALTLLAPAERYTYIFEGNAQALDHVFLSPALLRRAHATIVHLNTGRNDAASDHDPIVVSLPALRASEGG